MTRRNVALCERERPEAKRFVQEQLYTCFQRLLTDHNFLQYNNPNPSDAFLAISLLLHLTVLLMRNITDLLQPATVDEGLMLTEIQTDLINCVYALAYAVDRMPCELYSWCQGVEVQSEVLSSLDRERRQMSELTEAVDEDVDMDGVAPAGWPGYFAGQMVKLGGARWFTQVCTASLAHTPAAPPGALTGLASPALLCFCCVQLLLGAPGICSLACYDGLLFLFSKVSACLLAPARLLGWHVDNPVSLQAVTSRAGAFTSADSSNMLLTVSVVR